MGEKIVVGPINKGFKNNVTPFNIDNDSFPDLINAYQWRGRVKRKRGTSQLGRLTRNIPSSAIGSLDGSGQLTVNLKVVLSLETNSSIVPGSVVATILAIPIADINPVSPGTPPNGNLFGTTGIVRGTINYSTGVITFNIAILAGQAVTITFNYYPDLPVMGLEEFLSSSITFPGTIAFDTKYSYNIVTSNPYPIYDVSYYKNPPADAVNYPGYVPKSTVTPTTWNGQDYQQFWTTNYEGAMWATNGINVPFSITNIGMQYNAITTVTVLTPTTATLAIANHGLVIGDFVFVNEVVTTTGINFQTGYVTAIVANVSITVTFPDATIATNGTGGIAQYLTNRSDTTKDCLRWYDGDPTNGISPYTTLTGEKGWVNFAPPLSRDIFSVAQTDARQYYLVGARMIVPFKGRLLFFGPVIQTSAAGSQIYLQDTVIYSQDGTPYYTSSFTGDPSLPTTVFNPILTPTISSNTPINYQTSQAPAYWEDQTGFGGFVSAGIDQPLLTVTTNRDVLITGFSTLQAKLVFSGNDVVPFQFYLINSELGSGSTFSAINMDNGVISRGSRGYLLTNQESCTRIDLEIPDQVYQIKLIDNGPERFCAIRDYVNEWIYLTYTSNQEIYKFPNQSLQFNYRDNSWAVFNEAYTTYGTFRKNTGFTWATVGKIYSSWSKWNVPWNSGASTLLQPDVIGGNQQGFVMVRSEDGTTDEGDSLYIQDIDANSVVTSPDHTLNNGDYIIISGALGTIGAQVNGKIFSISVNDANTFVLDPTIDAPVGTYLGAGVIKRAYVPYIQTKQFPPSWGLSRKTRIGVQQYLLTTTANSQIQLLIFLSMNDESPYNIGPIVPDVLSVNNSLIYSTVLYTCPESTNLGLTPANVNLQMPTAVQQQQIWHRINTSLIGDTIQLGFTMSDEQMRALEISTTEYPITGITLGNPTILTIADPFEAGEVINISGVVGTTQLNGNNYYVLSSTATTVSIDVDSTAFTLYTSGGVASPVSPLNMFSEIELHGFILDVTPSQVLA